MSRNKTLKSKAHPKRSAKSNSLTLVESMEKDFKNAPTQLINHCRQQLNSLKQQEKKLKSQLTKIMAKKKMDDNKQVTLSAELTPTTRKKLAVIKKACDKWNKLVTQLTAEIDHIHNLCDTLERKQAKYTAISKQLSHLHKEFNALRDTVSKKPAKKRKTKIKSSHPATKEPTHSNEENSEIPMEDAIPEEMST